MGFLDFLLGKKKEIQPKAQPKTASNSSAQAFQKTTISESVKPQAKPAVPNAAMSTMEPFVFKSDCHQRFENGHEVMELQQCGRTISVGKNTSGCRGYKLNPGDGYIVKVFNEDIGKPNMSDKPMRIVSKTADKIELRGFPIEAQTPFGWQEVDYRDYGLTVYYANGRVVKCVLHMFDRNVDLEYRKGSKTKDRYSVMVETTSFNPFNITTEPRLQNPNRLPNLRSVFIKELTSMLNNKVLTNIQSDQEIVKSYVFNLVESYYNNAGYVPKNTLDEILSEIYKSLQTIRRDSIFPSEENLKYQMYYCFLNN